MILGGKLLLKLTPHMSVAYPELYSDATTWLDKPVASSEITGS
jgi:hypothetical protein